MKELFKLALVKAMLKKNNFTFINSESLEIFLEDAFAYYDELVCKSLKDNEISVIGHCANCGVEFHIHKEVKNEQQ
jgi:hypothetical protein